MQIDDGEAEAIALAIILKSQTQFTPIIILDDRKARRIAQQVGLTITGLVGVLLRAKRLGIIGAVKPILDDLNVANFRISASLYQKALQLANE